MSYLDNSTIVLDAVLTKKGRDLLSKGIDNFQITQYSFSDDEIDYTLWDNNHPSGSDSFGNVIENTPILEALTDEAQVMKYKLISIPNITSTLSKIYLPYIVMNPASITDGGSVSYSTDKSNVTYVILSPATSVFTAGGSSGYSGLDINSGYTFLLSKSKDVLLNTGGLFRDLSTQIKSDGAGSVNTSYYTDSDSIVRVGSQLIITLGITQPTYPTTTVIPITVTGNESGAIFQFTLNISKGAVLQSYT